MDWLLIFVAALFATWATTPLAMRLAKRWDVVAVPGGRRKHIGRIGQLGGISLSIGYAVGIGLILWLMPVARASAEYLPLRGVLLGTTIAAVGGLIDDRYDLAPRWQFTIQFVAAAVANLHIAFLERISNPFPMLTTIPIPGFSISASGSEIVFATWLAWFITTVWIVGMINAINWLDGLDGLAAGVGAIACLVFFSHGYSLGQTTVAAFPLALAGALVGFLWFNFAPARIFLGSAGVYILSYNLATLSFLAPAKLATALLVLALPLIDGVWRTIDRIRDGRSPLSGDRGHLHFILRDRGWPVRRIVLMYYAIAVIFGCVALYIPSPLAKFTILAVLGIVILLILIRLSSTARKPN